MKRSVLTLLLLCTPLISFAQSVWQGSCAVGTYGSFPSTGLYGASNSFPQNTLVTVENLETNRTATVLIIDRLKNSGLFLLLSRDAGAAVGLSSGQVSQVRVTLAKQAHSPFGSRGDLPYSPDSDLFPAAGAGNPTSLSFLDKYLQGARGSTAQPSVPSGVPETTPAPAASPIKGGQEAAGTAAPTEGAAAPGTAVAQGATGPKVSGVRASTVPPAQAAVPATGTPPPPQVAAPAQTGPLVTELESAKTPSAPQPALVAEAAPSVPPRAGSAPLVSELRSVSTPELAPQPVLGASPAVPDVRNPGPSSSALAAATPPPAGGAPELVAEVPRLPAATAGGPQVSELSQASPGGAPFVARVSALPALPAETAAAGGGPIVSALSPASPPSGEELAAGAPPEPGLSGFTPEVTTLAATSPPAGTAPPEAAAAVPSPPIGEAAAPGVSPARPPEVAQAATPSPTQPSEAPAAAAVHRAPLRPSTSMTAGSYYLQLGAYFESGAALALADNLSPDYPVSVYSFEQGKKPMYKVMIGPLNSAESGTLLYLFIAQGYSGAFVRRGN